MYQVDTLTENPNAHGERRIVGARGEMAQIFNRENECLRHLIYWDLAAGQERGHHYHNNPQWFYVLKGSFLVVLEDIKTKEREVVTLKEGSRITISGGVAHAVRGIDPALVVESNGDRAYDANDTFPYKLTFEI
eukprot:TRINITY_DN3596_c0_g1_i1.p1 TRINITY_DN3596_c0_g1~~TRINITY_DN3596_c0_g1_i1.p1  ORF type:complete len:134 (-),score=21.60 TRINITY_DN3596_c0_g1_i1:128-529(-)